MRPGMFSAAVAALLGSFSYAGNVVVDAATRGINFSHTPRHLGGGYPFPTPHRKTGKSYPFSSDRQHRRNARTQAPMMGRNGHITMQTLPASRRRTERQVEARLGNPL
jgi:hypothetical protein